MSGAGMSGHGSTLVITPTLPPTTGRDMQGVNRRLALFLDAMDDRQPIRLLRMVPAGLVADWSGRLAALNRIESQFWGRDVDVTLTPRRSRTETFYSHYLKGIGGIAGQPDFFPFGGPGVTDGIARQLDRPTSLVLAHRLPGMSALLQIGPHPVRTFFDLDDVEHRMRLRAVLQRPVWPGKLAYALHVPALFNAERQGAARSKATFVCSDRDRDHLLHLGLRRVVAIPNAVRIPSVIPPLPSEPTILFLGLMSYVPNAETAVRLVKRIMPLVWQAVPQARLLIAGSGSDSLAIAQGGDARIEYLGFVPDLDALYARSRVVCCPIRNGGGTRIKLIEAAAHGKAVVATPVGAEGLAFVDGRDLLLRTDDAGLADACIRLLHDDALCARLGAAANQRVHELYDSAGITAAIRTIMA